MPQLQRMFKSLKAPKYHRGRHSPEVLTAMGITNPQDAIRVLALPPQERWEWLMDAMQAYFNDSASSPNDITGGGAALLRFMRSLYGQRGTHFVDVSAFNYIVDDRGTLIAALLLLTMHEARGEVMMHITEKLDPKGKAYLTLDELEERINRRKGRE